MLTLFYRSYIHIKPVYGARLQYLKQVAPLHSFLVQDQTHINVKEIDDISGIVCICKNASYDEIQINTLKMVSLLTATYFDIISFKIEKIKYRQEEVIEQSIDYINQILK